MRGKNMLKIAKNGKVLDSTQLIKLNQGDKIVIVDDKTGISPQKIKGIKHKKALRLVDEATGEDIAVIDNYYDIQESVTISGVNNAQGVANEFMYTVDSSRGTTLTMPSTEAVVVGAEQLAIEGSGFLGSTASYVLGGLMYVGGGAALAAASGSSNAAPATTT